LHSWRAGWRGWEWGLRSSSSEWSLYNLIKGGTKRRRGDRGKGKTTVENCTKEWKTIIDKSSSSSRGKEKKSLVRIPSSAAALLSSD
jgi:hypothetical protein